MRRIAIVVIIGLVAAVAYALHGLRAVEAKRSVEDAVLEDGGRSLVRGPTSPLREDPFGPHASRSAKDVLLELRWTDGAALAQSGGPVLLSVRGNRVLFLRPDPSSGLWFRRVLDRTRSAELDEAMRALPVGSELAALRTSAAVPERRTVALAAASDLLQRFAAEAEPHWPSALRVELERVECTDGEALPLPSRFRRTDFDGQAKDAPLSERGIAEFRTESPAARRFVQSLQLGAIVGPDADGLLYRVRSFELTLP